jgi:tRNA(fMet)-specific endonuclease VapC
MNLLFDTNILIYLNKHPDFKALANVLNPDQKKTLVSVVSIRELKSLAIQNNWGARMMRVTNFVLDTVVVVEITENFVSTYAEIDAYSQRRNPRITDYPFATPCNMGKMTYG